MKKFGIWIVLPFLLLIGQSAQAAGKTAQSYEVEKKGGHDHAAMMQGMGKTAAWTLYPTLKARMSGENRETMKTAIVPQNIVAANIDAWSNNLKDENAYRQLPMDMGGAMLDKPTNGGFHWLSAREDQGDTVRIASIVQSFNERGAKDPTAMFMRQKHELEIIPQPYPREHARYRANEDWKFLVRFNGQPLSGQKVFLESSNGSMAEFVSDAQGVVKVHVPDDFKAEEEKPAAGSHNHGMRRTADLVLATEYADGGKTYLTAFNSSYGQNAFDQRNLAMGLGFTLLGMLGAAPLLRKRKTEQKSKEADNA
ncbi:MAG: hypothetical protein A2100_04630 [Sideroxydans sp. GWF2_59_14]|nr:MAG: hypothetical protein A2100_04630 [Sideroxydans sp. GWF2_59_14]HAF44608.1 hypothetical protein [Gallionellaceae bacterium]